MMFLFLLQDLVLVDLHYNLSLLINASRFFTEKTKNPDKTYNFLPLI